MSIKVALVAVTALLVVPTALANYPLGLTVKQQNTICKQNFKGTNVKLKKVIPGEFKTVCSGTVRGLPARLVLLRPTQCKVRVDGYIGTRKVITRSENIC